MTLKNVDLKGFYEALMDLFNAKLPIRHDNNFAIYQHYNHRIGCEVASINYILPIDINFLEGYLPNANERLFHAIFSNREWKDFDAFYLVHHLTYCVLHEIGHFYTHDAEIWDIDTEERKTISKRYWNVDLSKQEQTNIYKGKTSEKLADNWAIEAIKNNLQAIESIEIAYRIKED